MVMNHRAGVDHVLRDLHQLGVKLVMDDFGTGDSSLRALQEFPIDILKIDGLFVRSAAESPRDEAILRAIVQLGNSLGMKVIAEGIESREQLALLQSLNCDFGQGRLFSDDLTQERIANLLHLSSPFAMAA
jgi:EAL domain-containing protein (putative c-di-GMP-specific phosphodiesterase class I)